MVSVCAGLVTIDEESGIIRLVHYTTQEYLERTQKIWFPDAETNIASICVTYLSFHEFGSGICQNDEEFEERLRSSQLYDYASHNWGHHARKASTLAPEVISFLKTKAQVEASSQVLLAVKLYSLDSGFSQRFPKQMTGLHLAAYFGVRTAVNSLLESGLTTLLEDSYSRTPLSWAAENGHEAVVKLLLEKNSGFEKKDIYYGQTPLSWAAGRGNEAVINLLLERGAKVETENHTGQTPLSLAAGSGHEAVVKLLLEKGAKFETKNNSGWSPLSLAAASGHEAVVKLLLEKGAKFEMKEIVTCRSPSSFMAGSGYEAVIKLLLEKGAEGDLEDKLL